MVKMKYVLDCPKNDFLSQTCFFQQNAPSYKRETKSVKCRGVYLNNLKII